MKHNRNRLNPPKFLRIFLLFIILTTCFYINAQVKTITSIKDLELLDAEYPGDIVIKIVDTNLTELPPEVYAIKNLTAIMLDSTKIKTVPQAINSLKRLKVFKLTNGKLQEFPTSILTLDSLKYVELSGNKNIKRLPSDISNLKFLEFLILNNCSITDINNIKSTSLIHLDLHNNIISEDVISIELPKLEFLNLSSNNLKAFLPANNLIKLKRLFLNGNQRLSSFPASFKKITHLEILDVSSTQLQKLPTPNINLKYLYAANCSIESIPKFDKNNRTIVVDLSWNNIRTVPTSVLYLNKDMADENKYIFLAGNDIESIPGTLINSHTHRHCLLDISSNKIKNIPPAIYKNNKIRRLYIYDNPLNDTQKDVKKHIEDRHDSFGIPIYQQVKAIKQKKSREKALIIGAITILLLALLLYLSKTRLKKKNEALRIAKTEIEQKNLKLESIIVELNATREKYAEEKTKTEIIPTIGSFVHEVAGNCKNISLNVQMMLEKKEQADKSGLLNRHLEILDDSVKIIQRRIRLFRNIQEGKTVHNENIFEILQYLRKTFKTYIPRGVKVNINTDKHLIATINTGVLHTCLSNFFRNTGEHAYQGHNIERKAIDIDSFFNDKGELIVSYTDNGKGLPANTSTNIVFKKGYSTAGNNRGRGLYYAFSEVKNISGTIECKSEPGKFTKFIVIFPQKEQ